MHGKFGHCQNLGRTVPVASRCARAPDGLRHPDPGASSAVSPQMAAVYVSCSLFGLFSATLKDSWRPQVFVQDRNRTQGAGILVAMARKDDTCSFLAMRTVLSHLRRQGPLSEATRSSRAHKSLSQFSVSEAIALASAIAKHVWLLVTRQLRGSNAALLRQIPAQTRGRAAY